MGKENYDIDEVSNAVEASILTKVPLPLEIDFRNQGSIVSLLKGLVDEATDEVPDFLGLAVFGSVGRGTADNKSDIDLCYISERDNYTSPRFIRRRLNYIFQELYSIAIQDDWRYAYFELDYLKKLSPEELMTTFDLAQSDSLVIARVPEVELELRSLLRLDERPPIINHKKRLPSNAPPKHLNLESLEYMPPYVMKYNML